MFSGLLQKTPVLRGVKFGGKFFKQNYCHAFHTRFDVFFPLPSCCVSSLISYDSVLIISFPNIFLLCWYASVRLSKKDTRIDTLIDSLPQICHG